VQRHSEQYDQHDLPWRRREREKMSAAEAAEPLLEPRVELHTVLDEIDSIMNPAEGHVHPEAGDSDDKLVVPVPFHPTMMHDEYVKGAPPLKAAVATASAMPSCPYQSRSDPVEMTLSIHISKILPVTTCLPS